MNIAVIPAAGVGERMGLDVPKQFFEVNGKPLIIHTLERIERNKNIDKIVITTLQDRIDYVSELCKEYGITKVEDRITVGGDTNGESIYEGIMYVKKYLCDECNILVHDADRCLVSQEIINASLECLEKNGSAVTVMPLPEAIYHVNGDVSDRYVPRDGLVKIQTPYCYKLSDLISLYNEAEVAGLDYKNIAPCILMQLIGRDSRVIRGNELNFKITNPEDLDLFRALLDQSNEIDYLA